LAVGAALGAAALGAAALGAAALGAAALAGADDGVLLVHALTSNTATTAKAGAVLTLLTMNYSSSELP
jgi:hypothetical protein